jgi:gluconate/galactonate dehydratase
LKITSYEIFELGEKPSSKGPQDAAAWASKTVVLRVTTSSGQIGYGEAVPTLRVMPVIESLKEVGRAYVGREAEDFEANQTEWRKQDFYLPMSFESTTALSAFDIACWDIVGKEHGAPIHKLIGGKTRDKVRMYANGWYSDCITPEQFAGKAKQNVERGYTGLKYDIFGGYYDWIDHRGIESAIKRYSAVKEAAGDNCDHMIEHHGRFNPNSAILIGKAIEKTGFDPLFMEEPVHPEDMDGLEKYRRAIRLKVALGERLLTTQEVAYVGRNHLADFLQLDITNFRGVTGALKGTAIAEAFGIEMAFHNAFGTIQNAVTIQVDAAIQHFLIQESYYDFFPQWKRDLVNNQTRVEHGFTAVPDRPGIGVEVNEKILEEYKAEGMESFNADVPPWAIKGTWGNI